MSGRFQVLSGFITHFPELYQLLEDLFPRPQKLAIGLSGGSDSMFLSAILASFWEKKQWNPDQLFFLHCNHQLREESEQEAIFLEKFFTDWNFHLFIREKAENSREAELRNRRYACFHEFCSKEKIFSLALGHNLTDRVETTMLHMLRGCGISGFLNMQFQSVHALLPEMQVIRPLLLLTKQAIEQACYRFQLPFVQDQTNFKSEVSLRNRIRNEFLLPLSELGMKTEENSCFFESRKEIYRHWEKKENPNVEKWLFPLKKSPYWNADEAFERVVPRSLLTEDVLYQLGKLLGFPTKRAELLMMLPRLQRGQEGFRQLGAWTLFLAHQQIFLIKGKARFREKELKLEKIITQGGIQTF